MSALKIFVSSTCYDLGVVRQQLRGVIHSLGHEAVLSDLNDVLFDPRTHTHTSCLHEIDNCDILVTIVGSRFGGEAVPEAMDLIATSENQEVKTFTESAKKKKISITQMEVLKAIESNIYIIPFVDERVLRDHEFYEKNKHDSSLINRIKFPSIEKQEAVVYIFEFINFLKRRSKNNAIFSFSSISDMEETLQKQLSAYFRQLLFEERTKASSKQQMASISERLEDLKSAILLSIENDAAKKIARAVMKFRSLVSFVMDLQSSSAMKYLAEGSGSFSDLLAEADVVSWADGDDFEVRNQHHSVMIKSDGFAYECRFSTRLKERVSMDWEDFKTHSDESRKIIAETIRENEESRAFPPRVMFEIPVVRKAPEACSVSSDVEIPF